MFSEKTIFILGAGASVPYGYPTGIELVEKIIDAINNDEIYLALHDYGHNGSPSNLQSDSIFFKNEVVEKIADFFEAYKKYMTQSLEKYQKRLAYQVEHFYCKEYIFRKVKLNWFKDLREFSEYLNEFDPTSIDSFLRDHPQFSIVGKVMIGYVLMRCENNILFSKSSIRETYPDKKVQCHFLNADHSIQDNWYSHLLNDIKSGCKESDHIMNNKVSFVTFNYDISLDHYIDNWLRKTSFFKETSDNYLKNLSIHHVYGTYIDNKDRELIKYGDFLDSAWNTETDQAQKNSCVIATICRSYNGIKLIQERTEQDDNINKIRNTIKNASKVVIIGFGFDKDNLNMLGFPDNFGGFVNFFEGKKIFYHDYQGRMRNIHNDFNFFVQQSQKIGRQSDFKFIRSDSSKIVDAYQYDFRLSLFNHTRF